MKTPAESVKKGVVNRSVLLCPGKGGYEIIAGHRRQKASELAGYKILP